MASETPTSSMQPLLDSFSPKESPHLSPSVLEDGDSSIFGSDNEEEIRPRPGFWKRLRMSLRRRNSKSRVDNDFESLRLPDEKRGNKKWRVKRKHAAKACVIVPMLVVIFFGILHILNVFLGYVPTFLDDHAALSLDRILPDNTNLDTASQLLDITRDVTPIPCHSHNDYWRRVPLYDALRWGCTGVEADVWLLDEELYVGHKTNALTQNGTFRKMYVDPLVKILEHKNEVGQFSTSSDLKNGVFNTEPAQTLVLLVDFKNNGRDIFPVVSQQLAALREKGYLTYFDGNSTIEGAITVVATGDAPFDLITANLTYRDIFFDAPLDLLAQEPSFLSDKRGGQGTVGTTPASHFDSTNSYYASTNFGKSIGWLWFGHISDAQLSLIRAQIKGAKERGLKARYWSAPKWPVGLRNKVWKVLVEEGVGYLNGDDLQGMARLDWGVRRHPGLVG